MLFKASILVVCAYVALYVPVEALMLPVEGVVLGVCCLCVEL